MPSSTISSIDEASRFIASNQIAGWDFSPALEAAVAAGSSPSTSKFVEESLPLLVPALVDPDEVRHLREHLRSLQAATTLLCARLRLVAGDAASSTSTPHPAVRWLELLGRVFNGRSRVWAIVHANDPSPSSCAAARTRTADLLSQHLWARGQGVLGDRWRLSVLPIHSNRPLPPRLGAASAE